MDIKRREEEKSREIFFSFLWHCDVYTEADIEREEEKSREIFL